LLERSTLIGKEHAWPIAEIPAVIDAAEAANLVSVGGQLMFHLPNEGPFGATGECYWVGVETHRELSDARNWSDKVRIAASAARRQFSDIQQRYDFEAEVRDGFGSYLSAFEADGHSIAQAMWFAWYVESEESHSNSTMT
jgi:hypothetical protein